MAKKKRKKNPKRSEEKKSRYFQFSFPPDLRNWIIGIVFILLAIILGLSFFELSGLAGKLIVKNLSFLIGRAIFLLPLILVLSSLIFFRPKYQNFLLPLFLAIFLSLLGIAGFLAGLKPGEKIGGWLGNLISLPFLKFFGLLVTEIIFAFLIIISGLIFWQLLGLSLWKKEEVKLEKEKIERTSLIRRLVKKMTEPKFKVKEISPPKERERVAIAPELKVKEIEPKPVVLSYQSPPLDLLEPDRGGQNPGDTGVNAAIIKKTLQNFDIPVEMSEINIGPTVTQYTLKPAEGIKLSKITALSNDLALALASHPIRIEAPIPGRSLVGIEVPNKVRARVRLRDLIENPDFQKSPSNLIFVLGRDVSGNPIYADLAKMPHLLIAGSTGTGKTVQLNSTILSLLYRNSPEILRFILIDPKRVEFSIYNELPHLLAPVIFDAQKTINALKWLISEMERRFDVLSSNGSRDIGSYNEKILKAKEPPLPYIVLIIDELADLMAARGREIEAGIVRLAQMARAVGIHLVVATQRPSVEVITGLIKANITSRITFQVASQVDSRTVLDMAGAEKLLGLGDMLYLSAEIVKPKRIQAAYVTEKEVKKVVDWIKSKIQIPSLSSEIIETDLEPQIKNRLAEDLEKTLTAPESEFESFTGQDPFYPEAKRVVIEAKKASASLLQRRLKIGYARAARLIDLLEEKGVVGPGQGAKPREVYIKEDEENEGWQKI